MESNVAEQNGEEYVILLSNTVKSNGNTISLKQPQLIPKSLMDHPGG